MAALVLLFFFLLFLVRVLRTLRSGHRERRRLSLLSMRRPCSSSLVSLPFYYFFPPTKRGWCLSLKVWMKAGGSTILVRPPAGGSDGSSRHQPFDGPFSSVLFPTLRWTSPTLSRQVVWSPGHSTTQWLLYPPHPPSPLYWVLFFFSIPRYSRVAGLPRQSCTGDG